MIKFLQRLVFHLPKYKKNVWWNRRTYLPTKFPIVNWEEIGYINCKVGVIVPMKDLKNGRYAYYKVTKVYRKRGGDWLRDSDRYDCDMIFETVRKGLGVVGVKKTDKPRYI